ncbi:MAG: putative DNA binding domain-containing protein [Methylobacter sp.]|nr:putative DNA binding domain-containing protein [Methylobacter sp.]
MTRDELLARLNSIEWNDIEFKEASWKAPKDALSTVSAFANTTGGHLVFGIKQENSSFSVSGVIEADKVQNEFLGQIRDKNKISIFLPVSGQLHSFDESTIIVFYVPEAQRNEKPIYLDGNPKKAYIRRGGRDDTCTGDELIRFIRDASDIRYDSELLPDLNIERCFDEPTIRWYRQRHSERNPGRYEQLSDIEFLHQMACVAEKQNLLIPTRAGILVFGTDAAFRQILKRPIVDFQVYIEAKADYSADVRWADRMTPVPEENLIKTWQALVNFYTRHAEHPFAIDPGSLRRTDDPPDYISFREAVINLLIHQDFGDQTRWPTLRFFRDCSEFFNPGDAFSSKEQLLDPGEKPVRNPSVVAIFRRIGLSDQAGSGVGAIYASCRKLGNVPPVIENEKAEKSFKLILQKERLITEAQLLSQAKLGVNLSEQEAAVFAYITRNGHIDLADVKGLTGLNGTGAQALIRRLTVQALLEPVGESEHLFSLALHLRHTFTAESIDIFNDKQAVEQVNTEREPSEQVTVHVANNAAEQVSQLVQLSSVQRIIIKNTDTPRTLNELLALTGYKQRPHFRAQHLEPLLSGGVLRMTVPEKPRSSKQKYVLTAVGVKLKAHASAPSGTFSEQEPE